jgi:multiple sugar transport system ATP-binding protein
MTVRENLVFALKANKVDALEISKRLSTIAELLDIGPVLDRLPASLSGGQRQRVALGRAIMRQPALFLFDEPLSNVDLKLRATLRREILELCRKIAATAIYVTHDQTEAMTMADRLVVLHSGRVMQKGPPLTIYDDPKNLFVASFLGSPGINLLPFERVAEGFRLNHSDHVIALPSFCAAAQSDALILGIRPEHIATSPPDKDCLALPVYVHSVEQLGAETIVYGKLGCHEVLVRTKRGLYQLKQVVDFSVRLSDVLLFDALSGARLPWRAP